MTDASRRNGAGQPGAHALNGSAAIDLASDQEVETAALAGAAAIQKLVAERNELRSRLAALEQETPAYRALNNELRRRLLLVHQSFVDMAKGVVGDLERFDAMLRDTAKDAHSPADTAMQWEDAARSAASNSAPGQHNGAGPVNGASVNGASVNGAGQQVP